ncbi:MAG: hypothetical protein GKR88_14340 [Flavobacteriaceae bacterium]|nr:MAG: hypothetical protein GKR88_14340 [Flavobacteriaceae bacterium]
MRYIVRITGIFCVVLYIWNCSSSQIETKSKKEEPVVIANDSLEYEIIIIDVGFNTYLNTIAKPPGYHNQTYLELKNRNYVIAWNYRARNIPRFNEGIYENEINYDPSIDYGYDVNYKLFNYFEFAQRKYNIRLIPGYSLQNLR